MMRNFIDRYVQVHPEICHGKPVFRGTRILVHLVLEMLEDGASLREIRRAYPHLTALHVKAALHYAAGVLREREFDPAFLRAYELSA